MENQLLKSINERFPSWQTKFHENWDDTNSGIELAPQPGIYILLLFKMQEKPDELITTLQIKYFSINSSQPVVSGTAHYNMPLKLVWSGDLPNIAQGTELEFLSSFLESWNCWTK